MCDIDIVLYRGFGGLSHSVENTIRSTIDILRESGITVCLSRVIVPVLDEEFKPSITVNGVSYDVDVDSDVSLVILNGVVTSMIKQENVVEAIV